MLSHSGNQNGITVPKDITMRLLDSEATSLSETTSIPWSLSLNNALIGFLNSDSSSGTDANTHQNDTAASGNSDYVAIQTNGAEMASAEAQDIIFDKSGWQPNFRLCTNPIEQ